MPLLSLYRFAFSSDSHTLARFQTYQTGNKEVLRVCLALGEASMDIQALVPPLQVSRRFRGKTALPTAACLSALQSEPRAGFLQTHNKVKCG